VECRKKNSQLESTKHRTIIAIGILIVAEARHN
jgi:hypothetical protein